jgi:hypothetical protein
MSIFGKGGLASPLQAFSIGGGWSRNAHRMPRDGRSSLIPEDDLLLEIVEASFFLLWEQKREQDRHCKCKYKTGEAFGDAGIFLKEIFPEDGTERAGKQ